MKKQIMVKSMARIGAMTRVVVVAAGMRNNSIPDSVRTKISLALTESKVPVYLRISFEGECFAWLKMETRSPFS